MKNTLKVVSMVAAVAASSALAGEITGKIKINGEVPLLGKSP